MKSKILFAGLFALTFSFTSCDKKDDNPTPDPTTQQPTNNNPQTATGMSSKVDNTDRTAIVPVASLQGGNFSLAGSNLMGQAIGLNTSSGNITQPGTYAAMGLYTEFTQGTTSGPMWMGPMATVVITKLDMTNKKVSGTFTFSAMAAPGTGATGTKNVTSGVFNEITFQ